MIFFAKFIKQLVSLNLWLENKLTTYSWCPYFNLKSFSPLQKNMAQQFRKTTEGEGPALSIWKIDFFLGSNRYAVECAFQTDIRVKYGSEAKYMEIPIPQDCRLLSWVVWGSVYTCVETLRDFRKCVEIPYFHKNNFLLHFY